MNRTTSVGIDNGTMMFNVNITSQDITISSGFSNMFVLGEVVGSQLMYQMKTCLSEWITTYTHSESRIQEFRGAQFHNNMFIHGCKRCAYSK